LISVGIGLSISFILKLISIKSMLMIVRNGDR
jgi:hypothetical protein